MFDSMLYKHNLLKHSGQLYRAPQEQANNRNTQVDLLNKNWTGGPSLILLTWLK